MDTKDSSEEIKESSSTDHTASREAEEQLGKYKPIFDDEYLKDVDREDNHER